MNDDPNNRPSPGQSGGPSGSGLPANNGAAAGQNQVPSGSQGQILPPTVPGGGRGTLWAGMTPDERAAYAEGTKKRRSRTKLRPSLDKHADLLKDCLERNAVMAQVFDDLIMFDPAVLAEFGPDGHRAFNAHVKR